MSLTNLKDVYIDQMKDLYSANNQAVKATEELLAAADDSELKAALSDSIEGTREGMATLETILSEHRSSTRGEFCKGMEGLVKEAQAHAIGAEFTDDAVRDVVIITQYQRLAHYAIAGYGCLTAFARRLGLDKDHERIQRCLDSTYGGDRRFTGLATQGINADAKAA
jgi:ferritin-like metal-binding protein YciE